MRAGDSIARQQVRAVDADQEQADYFRAELSGHLVVLDQRIAALQRSLLSYRTRTDAQQIHATAQAVHLAESERVQVLHMLASLQHHFPLNLC